MEMHLGKGVRSLQHAVFFFLNVFFFNYYLLKVIFREIFTNYFILCLWVFCLHVCLCTTSVYGAWEIQKRAPDPPELDGWASAAVWVLGLVSRSFGRVSNAINRWAIPPDSQVNGLCSHTKQCILLWHFQACRTQARGFCTKYIVLLPYELLQDNSALVLFCL